MDNYELLVRSGEEYNIYVTESYKWAKLVLMKGDFVAAEIDLEEIFEAWEWLNSNG